MLRKFAAGTSAAVVAAVLVAAPAMAVALPGSPAEPCSDPSCLVVTPAPDAWAVRRNSSAPPPVGTPVPEVPSSPPDDSGPGPGPGDSGPPEAAPPPAPAPPVVTPPPPAPEVAPPPPPVESPPPTRTPAESGKPSETVLPTTEVPPERLPQTAVDSRPLTVAGGASLAAAGLAWIGGARRRKKRAPAN